MGFNFKKGLIGAAINPAGWAIGLAGGGGSKPASGPEPKAFPGNPYPQGSREWYTWNAFKEYDYEPSHAEVQAHAANWENVGMGGTRGSIAQYMLSQEQAKKNDPYEIEKRQQADWQKNAPQHYDTINQMFQSTLGRDATNAEKSHFGSLMASGQVDAYGINQFLQALPEYVRKQDESFRQGLSGDLQKQDAQYYQEQIMPGVQSAFANQGRDVRSTGFSNALALAAQQQNRQREAFLSNLTANQYAGSQGLAQRDYLNTYGGYQGLQDYSRQRAAQLADATTGRTNDLMDYGIQQRTYDDYLRRYGKRGGWVNDLGTALNYGQAFANIFSTFMGRGGGGGGVSRQSDWYGQI